MRLSQLVTCVYILAHTEDVAPLETALRLEGFSNILILRQQLKGPESRFTRIAKCLLNHEAAWRQCSQCNGLQIVLEADFVPVVGFGRMTVPFPLELTGSAWGFLYSSSQRVYEIVQNSYFRGHSAAPVATIMDSKVAAVLASFARNELDQCNPENYLNSWDVYIRIYAQHKGVSTYIPFKSYGEHGGLPNPEHRLLGVTPGHRADNLWGVLHFLPAYAEGRLLKYRRVRFFARIKALLRLVTGNFVECQLICNPDISILSKIRLVAFGLHRLV